jgi:phage-related protein
MPTLLDYQIAIRSLVLGPASNYIVHTVDGLGSPEVRTSDEPRPKRHGDFYGTDTYGSRVVTIELTARGDTPAQAKQAYDALVAAWQLAEGEDTVLLEYKLPGTTQLALIGRPRRLANTDQMSRLKNRRVAVTLEFYSADAAIFSSAETTTELTLSALVGGRTYPRVYPVAYGGGTSGTSVIENVGNFTVWPIVRIHGGSAGAVNPAVENITQGKTLTYADTVPAGSFIEVDMDARTVTLDGTASRRGSVRPGSKFWSLPPGSSEIRYSATSGDDSFAEITYRSGWLG